MSKKPISKLYNIVKNNRVDELQKELNGNVTILQDSTYELDCDTYFFGKLNQGLTLMHVAAFFDALECVEYLVKLGIYPEIKTTLGYAPVHFAALGGAKEVLVYLCTEHNVDINSAPSRDGYTPICLATCNDSDDILRILFDCGAIYKHQSIENSTSNSPILCAISIKKFKPLFYLVEKCVPMPLKDTMGYSPLMSCIAHRLYDGIDVLLESNKVDVNYIAKDGKSALWFALTSSQPDLVQKLIDRGAYVNRIGYNNSYPIHWAAGAGNYEQVEMLINAGANVNVVDRKNKLPIHHLMPSKPDTLKILDLLIRNGNDINHISANGAFISNFIVHNPTEEFFKYIIDHGFDFSLQAPNGKTYYELIMSLCKPNIKALVQTHYKPPK